MSRTNQRPFLGAANFVDVSCQKRRSVGRVWGVTYVVGILCTSVRHCSEYIQSTYCNHVFTNYATLNASRMMMMMIMMIMIIYSSLSGWHRLYCMAFTNRYQQAYS